MMRTSWPTRNRAFEVQGRTRAGTSRVRAFAPNGYGIG
jgi:hypothetical protein